ncbi:PIN domain-containing protein [Streptosporangium sp. NBC_01756]|uniref:PIN domain-containing protein n=1 Tax=Streptosporangium sp. NBC_01756 TaxID=2975950 RepID=UPI002DD82CFE|nr:PIN domain-containing protein [Streptosporangium sp. NBC_01756]WSC88553.1 PIN domain-containing protein [Streptosporangium sp. NBC_01756]
MTVPVAIADTSALLAIFNRRDMEHSACVKARAQIGHLVISPLVLAELDYLISSRIGQHAAFTVLDHIMGKIDVKRYEVPEVSPHLRTARALMSQYRSMDIGLTDAVNAALAAEFRTDAVLTLDREHFRTIRPLTSHDHFRLLPDDL